MLFQITSESQRPAIPRKRWAHGSRPRLDVLEERTVLSSFSNNPADIQQAYGINLVQFAEGGQTIPGNGAGQTIALLESGIDPNIVSDLEVFDNLFSTPALNLNDFGSYGSEQNTNGEPWFNAVSVPGSDAPSKASAYACYEMALDIEWAHSVAPLANILDVQFATSSNSNYDVGAAAAYAASLPGVSVVSTSWGMGSGAGAGSQEYNDYTSPVINTQGQLQNVTFLSATGDSGALYVSGPYGQQPIMPNYSIGPSDQPNVIAVGGTVLSTNADGSYGGETGWGFGAPFATDSSPSLESSSGGSWYTASSGGFNGSYSVGSGFAQATWSMQITSAVANNIGASDANQENLQLCASWPGVSGASNDDVYEFYDETTGKSLGNLYVNQSIASDGVPDGNGSFQELGVFTVGGENPQLNIGDTLEVTLSNDAFPSGPVVADTIGLAGDSAGAGGLSVAQYSPSTLGFQGNVSPSATNRAYPDVSFIGGSSVPIVQSYQPGGGTSIVSATQSGYTVTITTSKPNGISQGDLVNVSGVPVSGYDGNYITDTSVNYNNNSFTYQDDSGYDLPGSSGGTAIDDIGYYEGTSLASPCWAGLIAIADQGLALNGLPPLDTSLALTGLYDLPSFDFNKETSGYNGYQTSTAYNLVTGLGSPIANQLILALDNTVGPVSGPMTFVAPEGQGTNKLDLTLDEYGNIDLYDDGNIVDTMPAALTSAINIDGAGAGTDNILTVDFSGGNPIPYGGVDFSGGGSVGDNTLNLKDGDFEVEDYAPTSLDSGEISLDGSNVAFQQVAIINDANFVDMFNCFDLNPADTIKLENGPGFDDYRTTEIKSGFGEFTPINFANKTNVALENTSSGGDDTFILNNPVPGYGLAALTVYTSTNGSGSTVDVDMTPANVSTEIVGGSFDTVDVGQDGTLSGIQGVVNVTNPTSCTNLIIDDSKDSESSVGDLFNDGLVLNSAVITWSSAEINNLNIYGGSGGNTFWVYSTLPNSELPTECLESGSGTKTNTNTVNVLSTSCPLFVDSGNSKQTVYIGSNGSDLGGTLSGITSAVFLENSDNGSTTAYIDDSGDWAGQTFTLDPYDVTSTAMPGSVNWLGGGTNGLSVYGGASFNIWNVGSTGTGFATHVYTGTGGFGAEVNVVATGSSSTLKIDGQSGPVQVVVGSNAPTIGGGTVANIDGTVDVYGAGSLQLSVDDSGDLSGKIVNMTSDKIEGLAQGDIEWTATSSLTGGVIALGVYGGSGRNSFTIDGTGDFFGGTYLESGAGSSSLNFVNVEATSGPPQGSANSIAGSISIDGGNDGQLVRIGNQGSLSGIDGAVQVLDSGSGFSDLMIDDSGDSKVRSATLSDGMLTGLGNLAPITWDDGSSSSKSGGVESVQIQGGTAADSITVRNTGDFYTPPSAQFTTQILLGAGNNRVNVQATTGGLYIEEGLDATQGDCTISQVPSKTFSR
jgi:hypothetical protein